MLVLFETPAGYSLFKVLNEDKLKDVDNVYDEFSTLKKVQSNLQLVSFKKFKNPVQACETFLKIEEGSVGKTLKKLLKSKVENGEKLAVGDAKLGNLLKESFEINCVHNSAIAELFRSIREHADSLLGEHKAELDAMNLAVAHTMGRYRVKFNPEKIDTMIVQAVSLLDDLDKELNNYVMRAREWYGWHFPELGKLVPDHQAFAKIIKAVGMRKNAVKTDLSAIVPEELEARIKEEAEISMGTDISALDLIHIDQLCDQIIELTEYRGKLSDYLKNRMSALAPNLTALLGELVGARLVSHAGSLVSLAKFPASTVQILGAEKALFRALKTKKDTPKYGLIYHAQLVSQAPAKLKGKMARKLSAKVSLATRIDALCDESQGATLGVECRAALENTLRSEQERGPKRISTGAHKHEKYHFKSDTFAYDDGADNTANKGKKRTFKDEDDETEAVHQRVKKIKVEEDDEEEEEPPKKSKKDKKVKQDVEVDDEEEPTPSKKDKKKSKKSKSEAMEED